MKTSDCRTAQADPGHLFTCAACRARARMTAAWQALPRPEREENAFAPSARFVENVVAGIRRDRARRSRIRLALAAAAALLFFFCVGTGHETAGAVSPSPEDSYASLVTPDALANLIPN
ncbi:MAG: hypothetical protein ABI968_06565 [Acidobacteriota bacterium]